MKPKLLNYGLSVLTAGAALFGAFALAQAAEKKPNIVIIWGDDIGQTDISAYSMGLMGFKTPNIDRIAKEGVIFTDYYAEHHRPVAQGPGLRHWPVRQEPPRRPQ
jgi:hypothetical protein